MSDGVVSADGSTATTLRTAGGLRVPRIVRHPQGAIAAGSARDQLFEVARCPGGPRLSALSGDEPSGCWSFSVPYLIATRDAPERGGCSVWCAAHIATNVAMRFARVAGSLAVVTR